MIPRISEEELDRFQGSLDRCNADPGFIGRFYDRLLAASPESAAKFNGVDMERQKRMLRASLYMCLSAAHGRQAGKDHLEQIAQVHGRAGRDVRPQLYDVWLEALVQTVRESDPGVTPAVESAWRAIMGPGIEFMKSRY
jgi:hemoglobin-like flavoprotein